MEYTIYDWVVGVIGIICFIVPILYAILIKSLDIGIMGILVFGIGLLAISEWFNEKLN